MASKTDEMDKIAPHIAIRPRRKRSRLTQRELAELVGVTSRQIIRWELGETKPSEENRELLARTLGGAANDYAGDGRNEESLALRRLRERVQRQDREIAELRAMVENLLG